MENLLTIQEAASLLQSYGIECHWHDVKKWAVEGKIKAKHENRVYGIDERDAYEFLETLWQGNSFETEETKIIRLIEDCDDFKRRITQLKKENKDLRLILAKFGVKHT